MTQDKEEYTSHGALKEWGAEKDQNTLTQNIVALLGIHGMHCKFYEFQNASHITEAFESLFTQYHQDVMSEVEKERCKREHIYFEKRKMFDIDTPVKYVGQPY